MRTLPWKDQVRDCSGRRGSRGEGERRFGERSAVRTDDDGSVCVCSNALYRVGWCGERIGENNHLLFSFWDVWFEDAAHAILPMHRQYPKPPLGTFFPRSSLVAAAMQLGGGIKNLFLLLLPFPFDMAWGAAARASSFIPG